MKNVKSTVSKMADYINGDIRYSTIPLGATTTSSTNTASINSCSTLPNDDMEIPLINNDGANSGDCVFGMRGFRPGQHDTNSNLKAKHQLIVATLICFLFMIAELVGGYMAGSLAVVTDAAHLLSDCIGFIVALLAISFSKRPPDNRMTFGYKRMEVVGAMLSVIGIWILTAILVYLAVLRIIDQNFEIHADSMIIISTIGVGINIVMGSVLHGNCLNVPHGHSHGSLSHNHHHHHGHNHSHHGHGKKAKLAKKEDILPQGVINIHSSSLLTTHSRHNSFSKTLPMNGGTLLDTNEHSHTIPNIHRCSLDKGLGRINLDQTSSTYTLLNMSVDENNVADVKCSDSDSCDVDDDHEEGDEKILRAEDESISTNINIRAAMIHVIGDFVQSIGVLVSAIIIKFYPDAKIVDPVCTFIFSVIVLFTTITIMKESILILIDAVPLTINLSKLETELKCVDGVRNVHHLNVWGLSMDWNVMTVHLVVDDISSSEEIIETVAKLVKRAYNVKHVTIQIERQATTKYQMHIHQNCGELL